MHNVTLIWALFGACALVLGLMYGLVWLLDRKARSSLAFSLLALALVGLVITELGMMHSATAQQWAWWVRWLHVPSFVFAAALVVFVRLHLRVGRVWLMWTIIGMRAVVLVVNFAVQPNFNFARVDSITHISLFGETLTAIGDVVVRPWQWLASLSVLLMLVYLVDASVSLWRKGTRDARRQAVLFAGAALAGVIVMFVYVQLSIWGGVRLPALISPPFFLLIGVMAFEMSRDTLRAARLARELKESEERLDFAAAAAGLGLWTWDARGNRIWASTQVRSMLGLGSDESLAVEQLRALIHPEDTAHVHDVLRRAADANDTQDIFFRIRPPGGETRWIEARGRSELDAQGRIALIQGVLRDVTPEFRARLENQELRRDLAHVGRVSTLGTLSTSLAHELAQPLAAIQLNTEVAEMLLQKPQPDLAELRQVLADIGRDDRRAADIIDRLRTLLKRRDLDFENVAVDALLRENVTLLRSQALGRSVTLEESSDAGISQVRGDRVHLSQVLINLVMNAMDAIADLPAERRKVTLRARAAGSRWVEITVTDAGPGIPAGAMEKVFDPFFTTKGGGMGMGLSVSRTIVELHGGKISAANHPDGGAHFQVLLPAIEPAQ
jgi:two-component system, LuxR family, sensor kinase FixL